jgi:hypothetical protein
MNIIGRFIITFILAWDFTEVVVNFLGFTPDQFSYGVASFALFLFFMFAVRGFLERIFSIPTEVLREELQKESDRRFDKWLEENKEQIEKLKEYK